MRHFLKLEHIEGRLVSWSRMRRYRGSYQAWLSSPSYQSGLGWPSKLKTQKTKKYIGGFNGLLSLLGDLTVGAIEKEK